MRLFDRIQQTLMEVSSGLTLDARAQPNERLQVASYRFVYCTTMVETPQTKAQNGKADSKFGR